MGAAPAAAREGALPARLFTTGEAALYFARVDGCFGTAGGGGAEGNKSGAGGRAGGRRAAGPASSCQTRGPAPGPRARPGGLARSSARAQGCSSETATAASLRSAVSRRRVAGTAGTARESAQVSGLRRRCWAPPVQTQVG